MNAWLINEYLMPLTDDSSGTRVITDTVYKIIVVIISRPSRSKLGTPFDGPVHGIWVKHGNIKDWQPIHVSFLVQKLAMLACSMAELANEDSISLDQKKI